MKAEKAFEFPELSPNYIGGSFRIAAVADFDGDSKLDILFQDDGGHASIWYMDDLEQREAKDLVPQPTAVRRIVGTGDFDHDGKTDILIQISSSDPNEDGGLFVWYMDDNVLRSDLPVMWLDPARPEDDLRWRVVATADFDNDADTDILFQKQVAGVTGGPVIRWNMEDKTVTGYTGLFSIKRQGPAINQPDTLGYNVVGPR